MDQFTTKNNITVLLAKYITIISVLFAPSILFSRSSNEA